MKKSDKAEIFGMSFSMIFSIFLIIFFIFMAFIVVNSFYSTEKCAKINLFIKNIQDDVDKAWNSEAYHLEDNLNLPSDVEYVCFANLTKKISLSGIGNEIGNEINVYNKNKNMFFFPMKNACDLPDNQIRHINLEEITKLKNPYCIKTKNGIISFKIEKDFNEVFVKIE